MRGRGRETNEEVEANDAEAEEDGTTFGTGVEEEPDETVAEECGNIWLWEKWSRMMGTLRDGS